MIDFGNTVGDDFDRDSTPDKYIERKEAMTPLEAAQVIIDARVMATAGVWQVFNGADIFPSDDTSGTYHIADCDPTNAPLASIDRDAPYTYEQVKANTQFIALTANHAAAVAQAYKDAMQDNARLRAALVQLITLNDNQGPFGGEIYQDKVDRAWDRARAALEESR